MTQAVAPFLVPFQFAADAPHSGSAVTAQEPKSGSDTPSGTGPGGTQTGTQTPGAPGGTPGGPQQQPGGPCGFGDPNMLIFMGLALVAMYFLVMRPENKRRKQQQEMLAAIKVGDHVVTAGGMHGTVAGLTDKTVTLRLDTAKVTFDRSAIARIERDEPAAADAKKS